MNRRPLALAVAFAALATSLSSGAELQLTPAGEFSARDGRPKEPPSKAWRIDREIARTLIEKLSARGDRIVIDYEHQTLNSAQNGQAAPAAGWFSKVEWRDGKGLYATDVQWTAKAKAMIEAGEYQVPPVIAYDPRTGNVTDIRMGALTNYAAVDGMDRVSALAAAHFSHEDDDMNPVLKAVLSALGLAETATETEAVTALSAMKAKADQVDGLNTQVAALKAQTPDPAKYAPIEAMQALQTQVATLTAANAQRDIDQVVTAALDAGKLLPAQEKWARELGAKDLAALKAFVDTAQPLAALRSMQTNGRGPVTPPAGDIVAQCKAEFEASAELRTEFSSLESYTAYKKAIAEGRVKVLRGSEARA